MSRPIMDKEFIEKVIEIKRLSKKTKGGNKISFSALVVVGDHKGQVGSGLAKAPSVVPAIQKASRLAKKNLIKVPLTKGTIPHQIRVKFGAAKVLLKPAGPGVGIIAGGAIRTMVEAAGVKNIVAKIMGSRNKTSNVRATIKALKMLRPVKPDQAELVEAKGEKNVTKSQPKADGPMAQAKTK